MKRYNIFFKGMRSPIIGAAIFFIAILASSCKKPEDGLGLGLQPEDELLQGNATDTISMIMYTERDDSVRTNGLSNNIIGSYQDAELGYTEASTYFQLRMDGEGVTFEEDSIIVDSVFLSMEYASYYGNLQSQTFGVYEILDTMSVDSSYYSNSWLNFDSTGAQNGIGNLIEPGFETFTPTPNDRTIFNGDTLDPQLRLRLKNAFGEFIINSDESNLLTNEGFVEYFKGFHVRPENGSQMTEEGALLYFNLEDAASKVTIYYREIIDGDTIQQAFDLDIDDNSARFTRATHDYTGTDVDLSLADSTRGTYQTYVQTLGGLRTAINFPHIMRYVDSGMVAINKAELVLPVDYYGGSSYYPNDELTSLMLNDEGDQAFIPDFFTITYGGSGAYNVDEKTYTFVITGYIQNLLKGEIAQNKLLIETNLSSVTGNRCILSGPETINRRKPKLILTFTNY